MFLALIKPGSYLEFGRDVPLHLGWCADERATPGGADHLHNGEEVQAIRVLPRDIFDRIIGLGLIEEDGPLPREPAVKPLLGQPLHDPHPQEPFQGPVNRATMLVQRKVRDRQFRKRVLDAYESRCALTGMRLINGGGRAETEAAHIMSVEAGGPDTVANGIALSGTAHWMFDRGLLSIGDDGEILLSPKILDVDAVEKLIHPDLRARFPRDGTRPLPRYLAWHREFHRFAA